jgi:hypothetical protein
VTSELLGDEPVRRRDRRHEPEPEPVLEPTGPPWQPPRWLGWALAVVLLVGGVTLYADHVARQHESIALARCEHRLHDASAMSELRMGAMASYLRPALGVTHGNRQLELADLMAEPARRVLPGVQRADRSCRAVSVRPWHFSLVARRNAVTAYSGALTTLVQAVAARGRTYFHGGAALPRLRAAAGVD